MARELPALSHQNINERIYQILLSRIVSQDFAPGEKLNVPEIAHALQVSRTPVKDAVNRLAAEGLVDIVPRKGTSVARITADSIRELIQVRLMMEVFAGELAVARVTDEDVDRMEELVNSLEQFIDGDQYTDYPAFLQIDTQLHMGFFHLAGNSLLLKLYENIHQRLQVVRAYQIAPGVAREAEKTHREHLDIVAAFRARDAAALKAAITEHVQKRGDQFIRSLKASVKR